MHARTKSFPVGRRRAVATAIAIVVVIGATVLTPAGLPAEPAAAQTGGYSVEVTPRTGLVDGQALDVVVRAAPGSRLGDSGIVRACRDGVSYTTTDDVNPFVGGHCPDRPVSSSASQPWPIRSYPDGSAAVTTFRVGTGTVQWGPESDPTQFSLTCDVSQPCRLVIAITVDGRSVIDASTLLTFGTDNPIGACGGSEAEALSTGGPDRLSGAWIAWTRAKCVSDGSRVATLAVLAGEGEGQTALASGQNDLTYSAVGSAFPGSTPAVTRPSVSVPLALNATVIGVLGGYGSSAADWPKGVPKPYEDLKVTMDEMATLFGQGRYLFDAYHFDTMQQRNPELAGALSLTNGDRGNPLAPAGAEMVTWSATSAFDTLASASWKSPPQAIDGNVPDAPRGVHTSLALADPPFTFSLFELYSAQGQVKRLVADFEFRPFSYGPIWILTDLATAREFDIPTVALQNSAGEFVQPTDASLLAASSSLVRQPDGTYLPAVGAEGSGAYPLTFVEHAVAPTDALVDDTCTPRAGAQQLLADWLAYLGGAGQTVLPDGFVPLPAELAADAATSRAAVGTTTAAACAPEPPAEPTGPPAPEGVGALPPGAPAGPFPGAPSGVGLPDFSAGGIGSPGGSLGSPLATGGLASLGVDTSSAANPGSDGSDGSDADVTLAEIAYPDPTDGRSGNGLATGLALLALAVLACLGGLLSSGKRIRLPSRSSS